MFKTTLIITITIALTGASTVMANDSVTQSSFQEVANFVESKLVGKTLETKVTSKINNGTIETEFQKRTMYANLIRTDETASFDAIILIRQKLWDLDSDGKRSGKPRLKNRALVIRYGVAASKATGNAIGSSSVLTNSFAPSTGAGDGIQMRLTDGKLVLVKSTPVYFDGFGERDSVKPMANITTTTFASTGDTLTAETVEVGYDVDPKTLERTPNGHNVQLVGEEVPGLF